MQPPQDSSEAASRSRGTFSLSAAAFVPKSTSNASLSSLAQGIKAAPFVPGQLNNQSQSSTPKREPMPPASSMFGLGGNQSKAGQSTHGRGPSSFAGRGGGRIGSGGGGISAAPLLPPGGGRGRGGRGRDPLSIGGISQGAAAVATASGSIPSPPNTSSSSSPSLPSQQRAHEQYLLGQGKSQVLGNFLGESLRQHLEQCSHMNQAQWNPIAAGMNDDSIVMMPERVHHYHSLYPLEEPTADNASENPSLALGLKSFVFKGISSHDGQPYAIRRICGKQVVPSTELLAAARAAVDSWAPVSNHPHLVGLRSAFVSSDMEGGGAMFFVHDYYPSAVTLEQAHLMPVASNGAVSMNPPSERQLWSYLVQFTSALRCAHSAGLSIRPTCLHPSKVLLTSFGRIRIGALGIPESLSPASDSRDPAALHRIELTAVGQIMLTLACSSSSSPPSLDVCATIHGIELTRVIAALLVSADGGQLGSWRQLAAALADRTMEELDLMSAFGNGMQAELSKEFDNGRMMRLLVKLGFVNERPDVDGDTHWSETGDRYLLKLFRDFVFHQCTESGSPILDWGHVVEALNKLDAGIEEKILLLSRDEQSMLVASYGDLKRCVEGAYSDLIARGRKDKA